MSLFEGGDPPVSEEAVLHAELARLDMLESGIYTHPADIKFQVEAIAGGLDVGFPEADVEAPHPSVLDREGVLDVADARTQLEYLHGRMAEVAGQLPPRTAVAEIDGYQECEMEYGALARQGRAAVDDLVRALDTDSQKEKYGYSIRSDLDGAFALEDGSLVPVVCTASVFFNKENELHNPHGNPAIVLQFKELWKCKETAVKVADAWRSAQASDRPFGVVTGDPGNIEHAVRLHKEDVCITHLSEVAEGIRQRIRVDCWPGALTEWAAAYAALPGPTKRVLAETPATSGLSIGLRWALHGPVSGDEAHAAKALSFLFGPSIPARWQKLAGIPVDDL